MCWEVPVKRILPVSVGVGSRWGQLSRSKIHPEKFLNFFSAVHIFFVLFLLSGASRVVTYAARRSPRSGG